MSNHLEQLFSSQTVKALEILGLDRKDLSTPEKIKKNFRTRLKSLIATKATDDALRSLIWARDQLLSSVKQKASSLSFAQTSPISYDVFIDLKLCIDGGTFEWSMPDEHEEKIIFSIKKGTRQDETLLTLFPKGQATQIFRARIDCQDHVRVFGDDIWMTAFVPDHIFNDGGMVKLETPIGPQTVELPPNTQIGSSLTLSGLGMPQTLLRQQGDLIVRLERDKSPEHSARELLSRFQSRWAT